MTFRRAAIPFDTSDELYGPILGVSRMAALFHRPTKNFLQNLTHTTANGPPFQVGQMWDTAADLSILIEYSGTDHY
jgi:hypothetical protein